METTNQTKAADFTKKQFSVKQLSERSRKDVIKAIEKVYIKADKLDVARPVVTIGLPYMMEQKTDFIDSEATLASISMQPVYQTYQYEVFDLDISLEETMKMSEDWTAIGYISHTEGQYFQFDIDADYSYDFDAAMDDHNCDHCNTKRNRSKLYVLKSNVGDKFVKVGSSCIEDFVGVRPEKFFKMFQIVSHICSDEGYDSEFSYKASPEKERPDYRVVDLDLVFTIAKHVCKIDGEYIKNEWKEVMSDRNDWRGDPIMETVRANVGESTPDKVKFIFEYFHVLTATEVAEERLERLKESNDYRITTLIEYIEEAPKKILELKASETYGKYIPKKNININKSYIKTLRKFLKDTEPRIQKYDTMTEDGVEVVYDHSKGDYVPVEEMPVIYNSYDLQVKELAGKKRIRFNEIGFICHIPNRLIQHLERIEKEKIRLERQLTLGHIGVVGEKSHLKLTLTGEHSFQTEWGESTIYKMEDEVGNLFTKFGTINAKFLQEKGKGNKEEYIQIGDSLEFLAVVKEHSEFRGDKQTVLGRVSNPPKVKKVKK